jgi:hypothetical protein
MNHLMMTLPLLILYQWRKETKSPNRRVLWTALRSSSQYWYKRHWNFYRNQLLTDYVCVAYLLSPNPKVHTDAKENMEAEDKLTCERVLLNVSS